MKIRNILIAIMSVILVLAGILFLNKASSTNTSENAYDNHSPTPARFKEIPFTRLTIKEAERQKRGALGTKGAIPKQDIVFSNTNKWQDFWRIYGSDEIENIDFTKSQVAGVFLGEKSNSGYSVEIKRVLYEADKHRIQIVVEEQVPSGSAIYATVLTYPADLVMFPKQSGDIEFIRASEKRKE